MHVQAGVALEEVGQRGQDEGAGQDAMHIDAKQARGPRIGEGRLRIFHIGQDGDAAAVVGLAIERRADLARGALEQADTQPGLEPLDGLGDRRARQVEVRGGGGKAPSLHDPDEQPHGVESVHAHGLFHLME